MTSWGGLGWLAYQIGCLNERNAKVSWLQYKGAPRPQPLFLHFFTDYNWIIGTGCAPTRTALTKRNFSLIKSRFATQFLPILILKASWVRIISRIFSILTAFFSVAFTTFTWRALIETSANYFHEHLALETLLSRRTWDPCCPLND